MRKVIIILAALGVLIAFIAYQWKHPSKHLSIPQSESDSSQITEIPAILPTGTDETQVGEVEKTKFIRFDDQTQKIREIYGFFRLLNPEQKGSVWNVEEPYMVRYDKSSAYRIDADQGQIEMEKAGGQWTPRNARMSSNVVIRIFQEQSGKVTESQLFLENLNYNSERSEFSTDGQVLLVSDQAQMKGRGMILIYNPRLERMDYLQIRDLSFLWLKDLLNTPAKDSKSTAPAAVSSSTEKEKADPSSDQEIQKQGVIARVNPKPEPSQGPQEASSEYYSCSIREQVEIHCGNELVVFGADQVNINRIFQDTKKQTSVPSKEKSASPSNGNAEREVPADSVPDASKLLMKTVQLASKEKPQRKPFDEIIQPSYTERDILVLCKGGIVVQPMDVDRPSDLSMVNPVSPEIEMQGRALQIDRVAGRLLKERIPLAHCYQLRYLLNDETLEMFTASTGDSIRMHLDQTGSEIETRGSVFWNRKTNRAKIDGPGRVLISSAGQELDTAPSELLFQGLMNLAFADSTAMDSAADLALRHVNLQGGMEAIVKDQGLRSKAKNADIYFASENRPSRVDMQGEVTFETQSQEERTSARADTTSLYFDTAGTLKKADLQGQVQLDSDGQVLSANRANVQFDQADDGQLYAKQVQMTGRPVLENASEQGQSPARFEALQIDYDFLEGKAIATGPVSFSFVTPPDSNDFTESVPVLITAQDRAEFFTDQENHLSQAIFIGQVVADRTREFSRERQIRKIFGDRLVVDLDSEDGERTDLGHVSMQGKNVKIQSIHVLDGQKISHVELDCQQLDYDNKGQKLTAKGPGQLQLLNRELPRLDESVAGMSLRQPCHAFMNGFEQLTWDLSQNRLLVYGRVYLSYLPIEMGIEGDVIRIECVHAVARFTEDEQGRNELDWLKASGGVSYREDKVGGRDLVGDVLRYEHSNSWLVIEGSEGNPCKVDGLPVPKIEYNLMTDELKTRLSSSPAVIQ